MRAFVQILEGRNLFNAGGLDVTYGTDSIQTLTLPANTGANVSAMQSGDRMLLAGGTTTANDTLDVVTPYLVRFTAEGEVDTNFAGTSVVAGNVRGLNSIFAMTTLPNGQILIAGAYGGLRDVTELLRLTPSGKLDTSFGKNGVAKATFATTAITVGSDGTIVLGGRTSFDVNDSIEVARFKANGAPDSTFGTGGLAQLSLNLPGKSDPDSNSNYKTSVQFLSESSDGKVIVAGVHSFTGADSEDDTDNPYIARVASNGSLDAKFGNGGRIYLPDIEGAKEAFAIAADGDFLVAGGLGPNVGGNSTPYTPQILYKIRADSTSDNLSLDESFGTNGSVTVADGKTLDGVSDLLVQSDGKILTDGGLQLQRYNSDGSIDSDFSAPKQASLETYYLAGLGSDGSIFTAGEARLNNGFAMDVARYWREEGPAGLLNAQDIVTSTSNPYRFSIQWRDDDGVNIKSLEGTYIRVTAPDGQTYKAHFLGTTKTGNGTLRTANYKLAAPSGTWTAADNGTWTVRVLDGVVKDINGATASKRTLGIFTVQV